MRTLARILNAIWIGLFLTTLLVGQDDPPEANPARPTVSTPATLPPVGYVQFETGSLGATTSPEFASRIGINQVTKLAVTSKIELFVQTEPYIHSTIESAHEIHPGEVFVGVQGVLLGGEEQGLTLAVSYIRRLYESPAPELDVGTNRESGIFLISDDLHGFHIDTNYIVTEQTAFGVRRAQYGQTLSISRPLKKVTVSGELWHFSQSYLAGNAVGLLWAASYPVKKNLAASPLHPRIGKFLPDSPTCCRVASGPNKTFVSRMTNGPSARLTLR